MKAYVTSIGEPTTELCVWSLKRNGFDVVLIEDPTTTLAQKLKQIYEQAEDDFIRVDADVVVNRFLEPKKYTNKQVWWYQMKTFDWFQQRECYGGVQAIGKEAIPYLRRNIDKYLDAERPETELYRINEFNHPRRCQSMNFVAGLGSYRQGADNIKRVIATKIRRGQYDLYDFQLAMKLEEL